MIPAPLRFHWSMSSAADPNRRTQARSTLSAAPDFDILLRFCVQAEECGIDSLLTAYGSYRPDPIAMAAALGVKTSKIKFMIAIRSGVTAPAHFVQQVNTVSALTNGRVCLNIVNGHTPDELANFGDFLDHGERYARTDEFLAVCNAFWHRGEGVVNFEGQHFRVRNGRLGSRFISPDGRNAPEIFVGGNSTQAEETVIRHADCLWRFPDVIPVVEGSAARVAAAGKETGLIVSVIARPSHEEAVAEADALISALEPTAKQVHEQAAARTDSVASRTLYGLAKDASWLTPVLWAGAVPYMGPPSIALVGSYDEVADAMLSYKAAGVSQFLLLGWPDFEEMQIFAREVAPRVRERETALAAMSAIAS
ncbi:MAG TPA: LLM class flavin-dependent oxidoreductase [Thermoanaerobaculia bacterium]|nr:LLM class flavin-dependent oxidoreductase [Thermoanaerobaculia bacterium]